MLTRGDVAKMQKSFEACQDWDVMLNSMIVLDIQPGQIRETADMFKVDFHDALIIEIVHHGMTAANPTPTFPASREGGQGESVTVFINPLWTKHCVISIRHYLSSKANPTWECRTESGDKIYIRQANKKLWFDAGYEQLEEMALEEVAMAKIECYTIPGKDNFIDVQHVVPCGILALPIAAPAPKLELDQRQRHVARWAANLMAAGDFIVWDTETTGLETEDEIVEIGVVALDETILYQSLIKPVDSSRLLIAGKNGKRPVDIHHITPEMLEDKPGIGAVLENIRAAMGDKNWVGFNVEYDERMLRQSMTLAQVERSAFIMPASEPFPFDRCVMLKYAEFVGTLQKGSYRWWSLDDACEAMKVKVDDLTPHRAASDAIATLRLLKALAALHDGTPF